MPKKTLSFLCAFLLLIGCCSMLSHAGSTAHIFDDSGLLTQEECILLESTLSEIEQQYGYSLYFHTTDSMQGKDIKSYADDYYDQNGLGFGEDHDGMMFMLCMSTRDFYTTTCGKGISLFSVPVLEKIENEILTSLSGADYFYAFSCYASLADQYLLNYQADIWEQEYQDAYSYGLWQDIPGLEDGYIDDYFQPQKSAQQLRRESIIRGEIFVGITALIIAAVAVVIMKKKMNNTVSDPNADPYEIPDSFRLSGQKDILVNRHVNVVPIAQPSNNNTGHAGGVHVSSGGVSHGGHGGKF